MKKSTAALVTVLTLSIAIGVSACSPPASSAQTSSVSGKERNILKAQGDGVVGSMKSRSEKKSSTEELEIKDALDRFYESIADKEKAQRYIALINSFKDDETITLKQRNEKAREFFAEDMKLFDLDQISKDDVFQVLSVATIASLLIEEDSPVITVPLEAITVKDNRAFVDMNKVGTKDVRDSSKPAGKVSFVKKDGQWLITSFGGVK